MKSLTEREALDLIRATATRSVPNCINLQAIDRILADITPARPLYAEVEAILDELPTELQGDGQPESRYTYEGVESAIRKLVQTNAQLVEETHRWSAAVKKLEAERVVPPAPLADAELVELINKHLAGSYYCGRVWEAWQVGTMSEDDFTIISETDIPTELASDITSALLTRLTAAEAEVKQLQAFKNFVHTTLDDAGIDKHEELNATSGCRVGGRLKDLITAAKAT